MFYLVFIGGLCIILLVYIIVFCNVQYVNFYFIQVNQCVVEKFCQILDVKKIIDYIFVEDELEIGVRSNEEIFEDQCLIFCVLSISQLFIVFIFLFNGSFDEYKKSVNMIFEIRSKEESIR